MERLQRPGDVVAKTFGVVSYGGLFVAPEHAATAARAVASSGGLLVAAALAFFASAGCLPDEKPKLTRYRIASNNYHEMMEIPLLAGRGFKPSDDEDGAAVTVVSRRFADEYFDGAEAVGQFILVGNKSIPVEVVGVVGDVRERRLDQRPEPMVYLPFD